MNYKVLFIRLSSLGDIVLTEPAVRYLNSTSTDTIPEDCDTAPPELAKEQHTAHPELAKEQHTAPPELAKGGGGGGYEIHYLTKPLYADLVKGFTGVSKVYVWEDKINLIKALRAEKYDYIIDLHSKFSTFIVKLLVPAKKKITYDKQHFLRRLIVHKLTKKSIDTVVDNYLKAVERVRKSKVESRKSEVEDSTLNYELPTLNYELINELFTNYHIPTNKYLIGIFPGATHQTKQYPIEKMVNFLLDIPDDWQCALLVLGDWRDKYFALKIKMLSGLPIYDLTGSLTIPQLIAAISKLDIVITNDSGPMHIAAALRKHQIAIFGATHPSLGFRPLNENAVIVQKDLPCRPCTLHGGKHCPKGHFKCMYSISSGELFATFKDLFNEMVASKQKNT